MLQEFKEPHKLMGNTFELTVVTGTEAQAKLAIEKGVTEIKRIERLFTTFDEGSQTSQVNAMAGIAPVKVDQEVFDLIERSLHISKMTDGAFDLSYGSIDKRLWNFDRNLQELPTDAEAKAMIKLINYRNIILNPEEQSIMLKERGMRIGFGGIGKGYAADKTAKLLKMSGIDSGIINASGDIKTWGTQADGQPWTIGISHPDHPAEAFARLNISDRAIATSGNYEKYAIINGRKYSHTINPKTGLPVTGIKSVTVIAGAAELADALATPVTIMGVKAGLNFINQLPGVGCIIIDDNNAIYSSKNIHLQ